MKLFDFSLSVFFTIWLYRILLSFLTFNSFLTWQENYLPFVQFLKYKICFVAFSFSNTFGYNMRESTKRIVQPCQDGNDSVISGEKIFGLIFVKVGLMCIFWAKINKIYMFQNTDVGDGIPSIGIEPFLLIYRVWVMPFLYVKCKTIC